MTQRRFLIASSLARLIRKEGGVAGRIVEGYAAAREDAPVERARPRLLQGRWR